MKVLKDHAAPLFLPLVTPLFGASITLEEKGILTHSGFFWGILASIVLFLAYQVYENREGFKLFGK